ncbi:MAG: hypothetical protein IPM47_18490 [Sphingobacteriales bacterium]|nr:MAG: hypothetical protein IPM47_18490 [Sphingobacteriales bacterium]
MKNLQNKNQNRTLDLKNNEELNLSFKERQQLEIERAQREARWKMQMFNHI